VETPFSVADIFETRPSGFWAFARISPVQVTIVLDGVVTVLQPRRPADVAAWSVGILLAYSTATDFMGDAAIPILPINTPMNSLRLLLDDIFGLPFIIIVMGEMWTKDEQCPRQNKLIVAATVVVAIIFDFIFVATIFHKSVCSSYQYWMAFSVDKLALFFLC